MFEKIRKYKFFFQSISWNTVLEVFHEPWNTFMKHFYFSISVSLCMFLIDTKNCVYREKISSDSENLLTLILINNICCSKQRKKKNQQKSPALHVFMWILRNVSEYLLGRIPANGCFWSTRLKCLLYLWSF